MDEEFERAVRFFTSLSTSDVGKPKTLAYLSEFVVRELDAVEPDIRKAKCAAAQVLRIVQGDPDGIRRYFPLEWPSDLIKEIVDASIYDEDQNDVHKQLQGRTHFDQQMKEVIDLLTIFKTTNDEIYEIPSDNDITCDKCEAGLPCPVQELKMFQTATTENVRPSVPCATKTFSEMTTFVPTEICYVS
jgi:hypothetical protein